MTRAEEAALEAYPVKDYNNEPNYIYSCDSKMLDEVYRDVFRIGYERAEKDLALTWKDMKRISRILDIMVDDDFKGEIPEEWGEEEYYEEVLRRFNKEKEK